MNENKLWAILIPGPDDVFACANEADAYTAADQHNSEVRAMGLAERFNLPEAAVQAQVIEWPHSAESHAESLASGAAEVMDTTNGMGIPDSLYATLKSRSDG